MAMPNKASSNLFAILPLIMLIRLKSKAILN